MHKTGTTSVQSVLLNSAKYLEGLGYVAFVNFPQMNAKNTASFDPDWLRDKIELANRENKKGVIISAEIISTFNLQQMQLFLNVFSQYETVVIACFRYWVGFLPSRWAQNCSRRDSQSLPLYVDNLKNNDKTHIDARFDLIISRLIEINPDVMRFVSYDNAVANEGLVPTILSAFDFPISFIERVYKPSTKYLNSGKVIKQTELVRLFNGVYSLKNELEENELFDSINHATTVKRFYDNSKKIMKFLEERKTLKSILTSLLEEKEVKYVLSRNDPVISSWEEAVNSISARYIYKPIGARLFNDISDNKIVCSRLEADEIPTLLQEEMMEFLCN